MCIHLRTSAPAKSACAICWAKIIRAPVPYVDKTLYYTLTLKEKFHLNLFQRYWWVKMYTFFWATLYILKLKSSVALITSATLYNILCTVNTQHTSRQDAIIKIRLYLATCFSRKRPSSSQLRLCGVYLLYINYWIYRKCNLTVDSTINVNRHRKS